MLHEAFIEELRGWLTVNGGEIVKVEKARKKIQLYQVELPWSRFKFLVESGNS